MGLNQSDAPDLVRKLGVKSGATVVALNAGPEVMASLTAALPEGVSVSTSLSGEAHADTVLAWLRTADGIDPLFERLRHLIAPDGASWAVIPRKARGKEAGPGVTFDAVQAAARRHSLVDNRVAHFSEREYGVRFVVRREPR